MTWFEKLTGFTETAPADVRAQLSLAGERMTSLVTGNSWQYGRLETPTLAELRERVKASPAVKGRITLREVVANVQALHGDRINAGAMFQVASQFNLLEMVSPYVTPEQGVGRYEHDLTQGPACAIAAGAGTIYRNYLVPVDRSIGQSTSNQLDCLAEIGKRLDNFQNKLWVMQNGYALATRDGLIDIRNRLRVMTDHELDQLRQLLRIGVQWNTEVTICNEPQLVTQAYCSALPVAYSKHSVDLWADFAQLILDAAYEATFCAAILNEVATGNNRLYLTLLGGGVFGNDNAWIMRAIERALGLYQGFALDIAIVSHGNSQKIVRKLVEKYAASATA